MNTKVTDSRRLILASSSPRRQCLLTEAGYRFEVIEPPISEPDQMGPGVPAAHRAEALSYFKARAVAGRLPSGVVLAADTVVSCDGEIHGKPMDAMDARRILRQLIGQRQEIITGVTLLEAATRDRLIAHDVTVVWMRDVPDATLEAYLDSGAWIGKAGAYGIQDRGDAFVERIEGSFTNVVGLPMELVAAMLSQWGFQAQTGVAKPAQT